MTDAERFRWLASLKANQIILSRDEDHASNYVTAAQWIEEHCPDDFANTPAEVIQAMKDTNTIWRLQIYPSTPIGFNVWYGPTAEYVIDAAKAATTHTVPKE